MKTKLEELKVAYEAATPGEWTAPGFNSQGGKVACLLDNPYGLRLVSGNFKRTDATFIALAHNLMPALLEAVNLLETLRYSMSQYDDGEWFLHEWSDELIAKVDDFLEKLK